MISFVASRGYIFKVTRNKKYIGPPSCEYPREKHNYFRSHCKTFPDFSSKTLREVFYPKKLWGTYTMEDCPLEDAIIDIKNTIYDWKIIELISLKQ